MANAEIWWQSNLVILWIIVILLIILAILIFIYFYTRKNKDTDKWLTKEYAEIKKLEEKKTAKKTKKIDVKKKTAKEIELEIEQLQELKNLNPLKRQPRLNRIKHWFKEKFFPTKTVLINMELLNGFFQQFIAIEKEGAFKYKGKKYILDNELKYYSLSSKLWCYDYHENYTMPVKRKIPVTTIRKTLEESRISEIEHMSNPSTLERFVISKIAEQVLKGQQLDVWMKQIRIMLIITLIAGIIHLFLFMHASGMFKNLNLPF